MAGSEAERPDTLPSPEQVLATSAVRPRMPLVPVLLVAAVATAIGFWGTEATGEPARLARALMAILVPAGLLAAAGAIGSGLARRLRREQEVVEQADTLLRARRYDAVVWTVLPLLESPMLSPLQRARALGLYVAVLPRFGRYDQAAHMVELMLQDGVPVGMVGPLRTARIYSLLREDRLVDADRAITELKRSGREGFTGALLALAEAYRDVRTGHGPDLLVAHAGRRQIVASELGPRVADLYALAAWAALRTGDENGAARFWRRATLVGSADELCERYPEVAGIAARLPVEPVPVELGVAGAMPAWAGGVR